MDLPTYIFFLIRLDTLKTFQTRLDQTNVMAGQTIRQVCLHCHILYPNVSRQKYFSIYYFKSIIEQSAIRLNTLTRQVVVYILYL